LGFGAVLKNCRLDNYKLTFSEALHSLFISEYGLRHLAQAKITGSSKWGHRTIAVIQLCPVIGLVATIIEAIAAKCFHKSQLQNEPVIVFPEKLLFPGTQYGCQGPSSRI
jgi:hypothetical protein